MRIVSISTALFDGYPMETAINEIAASGARHVEPAFIKGYVEFDETAFSAANATMLRKHVRGSGLGVGAVSAHIDLSLPEAAEMLGRRIDFASAIDAPFLITNAGSTLGRDAILKTIESVLPQLEHSGVRLALENPGHGTGDLIGNARSGADLIKEIGSLQVCLNYDAGNVFTYSKERLQPADDLAGVLDAVGHIHLKDVKGTAEGWSFCAIGDGLVEYDALWALLPDDMPVSIELPLRLERPDRADPRRRALPLDLVEIRSALHRSLAAVRRKNIG
jgi:sugar phosphate isomerase/epimerase